MNAFRGLVYGMAAGLALWAIIAALIVWVANANPATPVPAIEASAVTFCNAVNANPTAEGVVAGLAQATPGLDEVDGAYVLITAIHHTCAQHEALIMDVVGQFAMPDGCKEQA